jgi:hypothetical protein
MLANGLERPPVEAIRDKMLRFIEQAGLNDFSAEVIAVCEYALYLEQLVPKN